MSTKCASDLSVLELKEELALEEARSNWHGLQKRTGSMLE